MELILIRHGETDGNARRQYIGRTDLPLNRRGREQVLALRERAGLPDELLVFQSPLLRTVETAQILFSKKGLSDARLAELDFGAWEAKTYAELEASCREHLWRWYDDPWHVAPPEGETLQALDARVTAWHEEHVRPAASAASLAAVTHGGPLRWWLAKYLLQDITRFPLLHVPTAGYVRVERTASGGWKLAEGEITAR